MQLALIIPLSCALALASLASLDANAAAPPKPPVVVLLPIAGDDDKRATTEDLRAALATLPGLAVQAKAQTAQHLTAFNALGLGCALDKVECMAQVGGLAGAELVVGGVVTPGSGDGQLLRLDLIDVAGLKRRSTVVAQELPPRAADAKARARAARLAVVRLVAPERERGAVIVRVAQKGATVLIDGALRGVAPLARPIEVAPGKHEIYVARTGFVSKVESFDVGFDETVKLEVELVAGDGGPPLPSLAVATAAAAIAAGGAAPAPAAASAPIAASSAPSTEPSAKKNAALRVAVYELELSDVDPRIGRVVTDAVVNEVRKLQKVSVVGMAEIRAMLDMEAQKQLVGCADDSCIAEIAEALGVDGIVIGNLAKINDEHVFGLRRLDQREARAVGTVTQRLKAETGEEFLAVIGPAVEKLFPEFPLRAGATRGVSPEVALRLTPPPLPTWAFWTGAATTGAVTLAAAGAGAFNAYSLADLDTFIEGPKPLSGAELNRKVQAVENSGWIAWGLVGGAVVGAAATGGMAMFTDWNGYAQLTLE